MKQFYAVYKVFPVETDLGYDMKTRVEGLSPLFVMVGDDLDLVKKFCYEHNQKLFDGNYTKKEYTHFDTQGVYFKSGKIEKEGYYYLPLEMWKYSDNHVEYDGGDGYYHGV